MGPAIGDIRVRCPGSSRQLQDGRHIPSTLSLGTSTREVGYEARCCPPPCLLHCPPGTWRGGGVGFWETSGNLGHFRELLTLVAHHVPLWPCFPKQDCVCQGQGPLWNLVRVSNCVHFYFPSPSPLTLYPLHRMPLSLCLPHTHHLPPWGMAHPIPTPPPHGLLFPDTAWLAAWRTTAPGSLRHAGS